MPPKPRYQQIADDLLRRLTEGEFPLGSALPSISALQEEYDVRGLNTVRQALAVLQEANLIESIQGRGTFVTAVPEPAGELGALREDVTELMRLLKAAQAKASQIERRLNNPDLARAWAHRSGIRGTTRRRSGHV